MKKICLLLIVCLILGNNEILTRQKKYTVEDHFKKMGGLVKTQETAIQIAEALLIPIFGEEKICGQKPYKVILKDDKIWRVTGTFHDKNSFGGVFYIEIQKNDCKIIEMGHGK